MSSSQKNAEQPGSAYRYDLVAVVAAVIVLLVGLAVVIVGPWKIGIVIIGAAVGLAGLLRLVLPNRLAGPLRVRTKPFDVAGLLAVGLAIVVLAVIIPPFGIRVLG